jgi:hypothetical protein
MTFQAGADQGINDELDENGIAHNVGLTEAGEKCVNGAASTPMKDLQAACREERWNDPDYVREDTN